MRKGLPLSGALLALLLAGPAAQAQTGAGNRQPHHKTSADESPYQKGLVLIKLSRSYEHLLPAGTATDQTSFGIAELDAVLSRLKVKAVRQEFATVLSRAFNEQSARNANAARQAKGLPLISAELLDQRHREFGLHLWFRLRFDDNMFLAGAIRELQQLKGIVDIAEPKARMRMAGYNDPLFNQQYSLKNTGQNGGRVGADLKVEQAWAITTGDTSVVVTVTDSGVKTDHEDLNGAMWAGIGYNFVDNQPGNIPGSHGSRIAGIIAARNNNGKGISGIAGGNGTKNSGVRVMASQIYNVENDLFWGEYASFIYAADNGSSINNNSWARFLSGSAFIREFSIKDATDYFIKYGGGTATKGGLLVWVAGNENRPFPFTPIPYHTPNCITVAATDRFDKKADFSSYGSWVDISAPGVDILGPSVDSLNGRPYVIGSGTSFAAPMVSGVAALVASVAPGRFTAEEISGIVLSTTDNIDALNPDYKGKLGSGRVNAYKAVLKAQQMAALPVIGAVRNASVSRTCAGYQVSFQKNPAGNDVMIAMGLEWKFDLPHGKTYNVGDSIGKGAKVVYRGPATSVAINRILRDSAEHFIKLWSVNGTNYSGGTILHADTSFYTLQNPSATQGTGSVAINFGKKGCPNSEIMVVANSLPQFGKPDGILSVGNVLAGGGRVIYKGTAAGYTHVGLTTGSYYYALYPVIGKEYGMAKYLGGFCFGTTGIDLPLKTSFETPGMPANFAIITPNPLNDLGWEVKSGKRGKTGQGRLQANNAFTYNLSQWNDVTMLQTAPVNVAGADSIYCHFAHSYALYDSTFLVDYGLNVPQYLDTLDVMISTDCGKTWKTAWKKWGYQLTTMITFDGGFSEPVSDEDWRENKINLIRLIPAGTQSIMIAFKNTNRGGGNLMLDDINIFRVQKRDAGIVAILHPESEICNPLLSPKVVLRNFGVSALSSAVIRYRIDNGTLRSYNWTGSKAYGQLDTVTLPVAIVTPGDHTLTVYTTLPNGQADQVVSNDTLSTDFAMVVPKVIVLNTSFRESFSGALNSSGGWRAAAPENPYAWQKADKSALEFAGMYTGRDSAAIVVRTGLDEKIGAVHDVYTPLFTTGNADSVKLSFSRAAFAYNTPGSTTDRLQVFLNKDCDTVLISLFSKTGTALTTSSTAGQYMPLSAADWQNDTIDVSGLVRNVAQYRFVFRVVNGYENDVYLGNVQLRSSQTGTVLPATLLSFTGRLLGGSNALLQWRTATETGTTHFELERSADEDRSFSTVARIEAKGGAQTPADYSHEDKNLKAGSYVYRLKMVDGGSGRSSYSGLVKLSVSERALFTVYPNPASEVLHISVSGQTLLGKQAVLTDLAGRAVVSVPLTQANQAISIGHLAKGTYLLKVGEENAVKVVKQ